MKFDFKVAFTNADITTYDAAQVVGLEVRDLICDHIGKGRILSFKVYRNFRDLPQIVYRCANLTQKETINKREPERDIYQSNIK